MVFHALLAGFMFLPGQQPQVRQVLPLTVSAKSELGAGLLARGESNKLTLRFKGTQTQAKIRLLYLSLRTGSPSAQRKSNVALEDEVYVSAADAFGARSASFSIPLKFKNGSYRLEAEVEGIGVSPATPVQVVDPPIKVQGFSGAKEVGGKLTFRVNFAPPNCLIHVTRLQNAPFPTEWWAQYNSVGAKSALLPAQRTENPDGTVTLASTLPAKMGAGKFQARVNGGTAATVSEFKDFEFSFPESAPARYTLRFESMKCLEETDEVGDDEIYAIHMLGITKPKDYQGYVGISTVLSPPRGFAEGQTRNYNLDISTIADLKYPQHLVWAVALIENDDDIPKGYEMAVQGGGWSQILVEPFNSARVGGTIVDAIKKEKEEQKYHSNNDEYLGWSFVPVEADDFKKARETKGWHPRSLTIKGDGGRYRLTFSISANPATAK